MTSHMKRYGMLFVLLVAAKMHILEQIYHLASTGVYSIILVHSLVPQVQKIFAHGRPHANTRRGLAD
jgi:hypothetical protein